MINNEFLKNDTKYLISLLRFAQKTVILLLYAIYVTKCILHKMVKKVFMRTLKQWKISLMLCINGARMCKAHSMLKTVLIEKENEK